MERNIILPILIRRTFLIPFWVAHLLRSVSNLYADALDYDIIQCTVCVVNAKLKANVATLLYGVFIYFLFDFGENFTYT